MSRPIEMLRLTADGHCFNCPSLGHVAPDIQLARLPRESVEVPAVELVPSPSS